MRALALDLGSKRIGVAISDSAGTVATPIDTVHRTNDLPAVHRQIKELVVEWEAEIVVVGLPISLDGSIGTAAQSAIDEANKLGDTLGVPVVLYDERLTTVSAEQSLMEQNLNAKQRRQVVDKVAASVFLQAWLDAGMPK